jgi:hypothetical protein
VELKSMKLPAEGTILGGEAKMERPDYPYGLNIHLDDDSLKALGMDKLPEIGAVMPLSAQVKVSGVSENASEGQPKRRTVSLQITDMALGGSHEKAKDAAQVIYMEDN